MDEIINSIKLLVDVGGTVIVTAMLYVVWLRLNLITDSMLRLLEEMARRDKAAAQKERGETKGDEF